MCLEFLFLLFNLPTTHHTLTSSEIKMPSSQNSRKKNEKIRNNSDDSETESNSSHIENNILHQQNIKITRLDDEDRFSNNRDARSEERWHDSLENLAKSYRDTAVVLSEKHDEAGYKARMKHIVFGLPGPIIAILVSVVAALWNSPDAQLLVVPLSALGAIFSAVHTFFDMGGRAERYWSYSALYGGIVSTVDATLARDIDFRRPPDEFFAEVRTQLGHLNGTAPQLPGKGCCGCTKYESGKSMPSLQATQKGSLHYENV